MPKVSIIIPTYNVAPWIEETLKSVSLQTSRDFECIIIDDMSTDDTYNIINEFIKGDRRFKLFRNKKMKEYLIQETMEYRCLKESIFLS